MSVYIARVDIFSVSNPSYKNLLGSYNNLELVTGTYSRLFDSSGDALNYLEGWCYVLKAFGFDGASDLPASLFVIIEGLEFRANLELIVKT